MEGTRAALQQPAKVVEQGRAVREPQPRKRADMSNRSAGPLPRLWICYSFAMSLPEASFFDYYCDRCGAPFCERVQVMNLALDYVEEMYCLTCLAAEQGMSEADLAQFAKDYVYSRECFKTPWDNFADKAKACPRLATQTCHCQD